MAWGDKSEGDIAHSWGLHAAKGIQLLSQQAGISAGSWDERQDSFTHEISVLLLLPRALEGSQQWGPSLSSTRWTPLTISRHDCLQNIPVTHGLFASQAHRRLVPHLKDKH